MKKSKILAVALVAVISLAFSIPVFALDKSDDANPVEMTNISTDISNESTEENGFFESLYTAFESNASEILSALAFIGSLIIMLCYKRGLLPIINDGLKALKSGIKAINEKSDSFNNHAIGVCDSIDSKLKRAEELTEAILESCESVEDQLSEMHSIGSENEKLKIILSAQIDMLYEIFMSASLPQYLKDNVGEKITDMKSALGKEVGSDALV